MRRSLLLPLFGGLLLLLFVLDLATGSVTVAPADLLRVLFGGEGSEPGEADIILIFRLPKALTAAVAGAGLAVSGLMMQTLFRNPLAGPSILGISSGASLGVAVVVLGSGAGSGRLLSGLDPAGWLTLTGAAVGGALLVLAIIVAVARRVAEVMTLLIVGLLCGFALNALVSVLIHFSRPEMTQAYMTWSFGSFANITSRELVVFVPVVVVATLISFTCGKALNILLLGETCARSMGLNVRAIRLVVITLTAVLTGAVTAWCGPVGFIGIAVPHLARAVFATADHRFLLPMTAATGCAVALCADILAQVPGYDTVLPLNAVTALIGSPIIIRFILRRRLQL